MAYNTKHTAEQIDALLGEVFDSTLQEKTIEITQSGTTEITADEDFLALKKVNLNVNVQGGSGGGSDFFYWKWDKPTNLGIPDGELSSVFYNLYGSIFAHTPSVAAFKTNTTIQLTFSALAEMVKRDGSIPNSLFVKTLKSSQFTLNDGSDFVFGDFSNIYEMLSAIRVPEDQWTALGISESTKEEFYAL